MTAKLVALTAEARQALGGLGEIAIDRFPFRVGRESRSLPQRIREGVERRLGVAPQTNDLYLREELTETGLQISREHFLIEVQQRTFVLVDRGSACGTIVGGSTVGGDRTGGQTELHDEDEIIVGTAAICLSISEMVSGLPSDVAQTTGALSYPLGLPDENVTQVDERPSAP